MSCVTRNKVRRLVYPGMLFRVWNFGTAFRRMLYPGTLFRVCYLSVSRNSVPGYNARNSVPGYNARNSVPGYNARNSVPGYNARNTVPGYRVSPGTVFRDTSAFSLTSALQRWLFPPSVPSLYTRPGWGARRHRPVLWADRCGHLSWRNGNRPRRSCFSGHRFSAWH